MKSYITAICTNCREESRVEAYRSININETPELKEKVMDGSLFTWECPHCGRINLLQEPVLYHDPSRNLMIWLSGNDSLPQERISALFASDEGLRGYTARLVDSIGDLIEKVKIFEAGLDDVIVEMCKYVTRLELCENCHDAAKEAAISEAPFKFLKMDGSDGDITLAYPLDGQMQMVAIGFNVYEDCLGIERRNPALAEASSGLSRIDAQWLSEFFR